MKKLFIFIFLASSFILIGCFRQEPSQIKNTPETQLPQADNSGTIGISNPASTNCIDKGGKLKIESIEGLGEYGICIFEDNRQCEEWALFKGECPAGGIKVTGYITEAAKFCAITGGEYSVKNDLTTKEEQGICKFKNNVECDVWEYYNGKCSKNSQKLISANIFECKDNKTINADFFENRVDIKLSDGRTFSLPQGISGSGVRYTNVDESIVFWTKGDTAFMVENDKTTFEDCIDKSDK